MGKLRKNITKKSESELKPYLFELLSWLQDINWPGAFVIFERLKTFSAHSIISEYSYSVKRAIKLEDEEWLNYLAGLIEIPGLCDMLPDNLQNVLKKSYNNFWGA